MRLADFASVVYGYPPATVGVGVMPGYPGPGFGFGVLVMKPELVGVGCGRPPPNVGVGVVVGVGLGCPGSRVAVGEGVRVGVVVTAAAGVNVGKGVAEGVVVTAVTATPMVGMAVLVAVAGCERTGVGVLSAGDMPGVTGAAKVVVAVVGGKLGLPVWGTAVPGGKGFGCTIRSTSKYHTPSPFSASPSQPAGPSYSRQIPSTVMGKPAGASRINVS